MGLTRLLLILLLIVLALRGLTRLLGGIAQGMSGRAPGRPPDRGVSMVRDPVCGTFVVPSRALTLTDRGVPVHFCSEKCRAAYRAGDRPRARAAR